MMLKAIVIEGRGGLLSGVLRDLISEFPQIQFSGFAYSITDGIGLVCQTDPDIVLIDLELPDGNGLEIIRKTLGFHFQTILVSNTGTHSLRAQRFGISDYLQKDVSPALLRNALYKVCDKAASRSISQLYKRKFQSQKPISLDFVSVKNGPKMFFIKTVDLESIRAQGSGTMLMMRNGDQHASTMTIGKLNHRLKTSGFFRVSRSIMVNLDMVAEFIGENQIRMKTGLLFRVESFRLESLKKKLAVC